MSFFHGPDLGPFKWDDPLLLEAQLTEDERMIRDTARDFAATELAPRIQKAYLEEKTDPKLFRLMGEAGLLGVTLPQEFGCAGAGYVAYGLVAREVERIDSGFRSMMSVQSSLVMLPIFQFGTEAQKQKYLVPLAQGQKLGCWSLTEPEAGSDAGGTRSTAVKDANGWVLNGAKTFTTNGHYADICVGMALTDKSKGSHGISAFILEKGTPGFRPGKKENKLGLRASDTSELIFEDCEIPEENLLGAEGEGFIDAMRVLDGGRISIAALALGIGRGALDAALKYVKERKQFGKAIAEFRGIQWKLADMATELDAARLLTQRAAVLKDAGRKVTRESSMAKLFSSEVAVRICNDAVQLFGGYGFIKDYPAEKYYRDVKLCTIGEGTSEIQRMVIAREILKVYPSRG